MFRVTKDKVVWALLAAAGLFLYWRVESPKWDHAVVVVVVAVALLLVYISDSILVWMITGFAALVVFSVLSSNAMSVVVTVTATSLETETPGPSPTSTPRVTTINADVRASSLNVRSEPDGVVIGYLSGGESVTVSGCDGSWCSIEKPIVGYVWRGCLSDNPTKLGCQAE